LGEGNVASEVESSVRIEDAAGDVAIGESVVGLTESSADEDIVVELVRPSREVDADGIADWGVFGALSLDGGA
jgi:hypothetical protein